MVTTGLKKLDEKKRGPERLPKGRGKVRLKKNIRGKRGRSRLDKGGGTKVGVRCPGRTPGLVPPITSNAFTSFVTKKKGKNVCRVKKAAITVKKRNHIGPPPRGATRDRAAGPTNDSDYKRARETPLHFSARKKKNQTFPRQEKPKKRKELNLWTHKINKKKTEEEKENMEGKPGTGEKKTVQRKGEAGFRC